MCLSTSQFDSAGDVSRCYLGCCPKCMTVSSISSWRNVMLAAVGLNHTGEPPRKSQNLLHRLCVYNLHTFIRRAFGPPRLRNYKTFRFKYLRVQISAKNALQSDFVICCNSSTANPFVFCRPVATSLCNPLIYSHDL